MTEAAPESPQADENLTGEGSNPDDEQDPAGGRTGTFSREYVEGLRQEAARYRERAKGADDLRHRLHDALVRLDGRLADPTDLAYADEHLDDIATAITGLIERKPHLSRRPVGDVGQGVRSESIAPNDFSDLFR